MKSCDATMARTYASRSRARREPGGGRLARRWLGRGGHLAARAPGWHPARGAGRPKKHYFEDPYFPCRSSPRTRARRAPSPPSRRARRLRRRRRRRAGRPPRRLARRTPARSGSRSPPKARRPRVAPRSDRPPARRAARAPVRWSATTNRSAKKNAASGVGASFSERNEPHSARVRTRRYPTNPPTKSNGGSSSASDASRRFRSKSSTDGSWVCSFVVRIAGFFSVSVSVDSVTDSVSVASRGIAAIDRLPSPSPDERETVRGRVRVVASRARAAGASRPKTRRARARRTGAPRAPPPGTP